MRAWRKKKTNFFQRFPIENKGERKQEPALSFFTNARAMAEYVTPSDRTSLSAADLSVRTGA